MEPSDFYLRRLDVMIDLRQELAVLASRLPWQSIEAGISHRFAKAAHRGEKQICIADLFGEEIVLAPKPSNAGRPRLPMRLMIAILYLKHAFNESDEGVVARWAETPSWQYFSGMDYFENRKPCNPSQLSRFRTTLGEEGVEEMLSQTVNAAVDLGLIEKAELEAVIVDSTVQPKAIAYPTDSKLLETARVKVFEAAQDAGIALKQTYEKEAKELTRRAGGYAHARQFRRLRRVLRRQRTILGRLVRDVQRKMASCSESAHNALNGAITKALKLIEQSKHRKSNGIPKLYSWHAPEVACIRKGKARQPNEFGCKVGIATTLNANLIIGARSFPGNPYDGHTLHEQLEQSSILMQDHEIRPKTAYVDLGYRGVDADNPTVRLCHRGKSKRLSEEERNNLKR